MEVALISDTHIPSRASEVPSAFAERVRAAEHTIHAGDFDYDRNRRRGGANGPVARAMSEADRARGSTGD